MKRFYTNNGAKFAAFCLLIVFTFFSVLLLCAVLNFAVQGCIPGQRYENSETYRNIMADHIVSAANLYRMQGEDLSSLSFVDQQTRQTECKTLEQQLSPQVSNFRFEIRSEDGKEVLSTNFPKGETFENTELEPAYATVKDSDMVINFPNDYQYYLSASEDDHLFFNRYYSTTNTSYTEYVLDAFIGWDSPLRGEYAALPTDSAASYVLCYGVVSGYPVEDSLSAVYDWYQRMQKTFPAYLICAVLCMVAGIVTLVLCCRGAGHRRDSDAIVLRLFDRVPFELLLIGIVILGAILYSIFEAILYASDYTTSTQIFLGGNYIACLIVLGELMILTTTVRMKARSFWRHTLVGRLVGLCVTVFSHLELAWKFVVFYGIYELISLWLFLPSSTPGIFFLLAIANFFVLLAACRWSVKFGAVRQGAAELAKGNLDYRIDTTRLPAQLREHANDLNHISDGMASAIQEQTRSERLKSELITNVSHDIKTPLTSIINYVDLLKAEPIDNPKAQEYIAVLERQSARLKKLTNDLVDASKASSGTMQVHLENVEVCELLQQATGEYAERLSEKKLEPVFSLPETPVYIHADGALLWRVIDNLLSNICKYALPGTRVYITAQTADDRLQVLVKNISRTALNIPADELMERFVRGDSSRNSEGSGLGLSIAQSLTELMGGTFSLEIDGDLFKAKLSFPLISKLYD